MKSTGFRPMMIPRQIQSAEIVFDHEKCHQCGLCITACAWGAIVTDFCNRADLVNGKFKGKTGLPRVEKKQPMSG